MRHKSFHLTTVILLSLLVIFVSACNSSGQSTNNNTKISSPTATTSSTSKTVSMPPTHTDCPADGTARAAVMAPLALGNKQNLVYIYNQSSAPSGVPGIIRRFDGPTGS